MIINVVLLLFIRVLLILLLKKVGVGFLFQINMKMVRFIFMVWLLVL